MKKLLLFFIIPLTLFVLVACGSPNTAVTQNQNVEAMPEQESSETMPDQAIAGESAEAMTEHNENTAVEETTMELMEDETADSMDTMAELPAWQTITLTNARTGEPFTLADFSGKTVFVEPMATWCTNCRQQLGNVRQAREQLGDDVIFIGLSLETNLSNEDLANYTVDQSFDWPFAVMTSEMLQSLADTFGRSITNAPSTPHFIIRADGAHTNLVTGIDSPDQIIQQIQAAQR